MTDLVLLEKWIQTRDAEAFRALALHHAGMIYSTCKRILHNADDAEDVAQECFELLARTPSRPTAHLGGWLHRVATNLALNRLKADKRRAARERRYTENRAGGEQVAWDDVYRYVDEAIAALPDDLRAVVVGHFLQGLSYTALGAQHGITRQTMADRVQRGIEALRASLRRRGVTVGASALAALLATHTAEAAPATLVANLGRLALTGIGSSCMSGATAAALTGGILMAKKLLVGVVVLVVAILALYWSRMEDVTPALQSATKAPAPGGAPKEPFGQGVATAPVPAAGPGLTVATNDAPLEDAGKAAEAPEIEPASVEGFVTDKAGLPVAGAWIRIVLKKQAETGDVSQVFESMTDVEGRYGVIDIPAPGSLTVHAGAEGYISAREILKKIEPGSREEIDLALAPARFYVAGVVIDELSHPVEGACVGTPFYGYTEEEVTRSRETRRRPQGAMISSLNIVEGLTDGNGRFRVAIPAQGLCDMVVTKDEARGFHPRVATGTEDNVFVLRRGGAIEGRVTRGGRPVQDVQVHVEGSAMPAGFTPAEIEGQSFPAPKVIARTDDSGRYRVEGLSPDFLYTLGVQAVAPVREANKSDDMGIPRISEMLRTLRELDETPWLARKERIAVRSGQKTPGVDLVLGEDVEPAVIRGVVTDRGSGKPVCPVAVAAVKTDASGRRVRGSPVETAVTEPDGSYIIDLPFVEKGSRFALICKFYTEGGSNWGNTDRNQVNLDVNPGEEKVFDFSVDAPLTVPIRFVDEDGEPVQGVMSAIRQADQSGGCGGLTSDAEGRVVHHGLPAGLSYRAVAWASGQGVFFRVLGVSAPFTGRPGETVSEVEVKCRTIWGGIQATFVDDSGNPVAGGEIACKPIPAPGNDLPDPAKAVMDTGASTGPDGSLAVTDMLPEGRYTALHFFLDASGRDATEILVATVRDVEIRAGAPTALGTVSLERMPKEKAQRLLRGE
jgi:RNA polymerase sigma factor (sigma-70 family)